MVKVVTTHICDKCKRTDSIDDTEPNRQLLELIDIVVCVVLPEGEIFSYQKGSAFPNFKISVCRDCLKALIPLEIKKEEQRSVFRERVSKTIGEKFEDLIREVIQEEIPQQ